MPCPAALGTDFGYGACEMRGASRFFRNSDAALAKKVVRP
jgi:hypothetical protein